MTNLIKTHTSSLPTSHPSFTTMESPPPHDHEQPKNIQHNDSCKLVIMIPEVLLATLRSTYATKAKVPLLRRIQGKQPRLKALTAWAWKTLNLSLSLLSLNSNKLFEVTFVLPEGRIHALTQANLSCESATIFFSHWCPHFDSKNPHGTERLDHPVWVQIVDLCQVLREETFLKIIGAHIG